MTEPIAYLADFEDVAKPVKAVEHFCDVISLLIGMLIPLTDGCTRIVRADKHHRAVALGSSVHQHANISSDNFSRLAHEIFQILP